MHQHSCTLKSENESITLFGRNVSWFGNLRTFFLISSENPLNAKYFRSETAIKAEQKRQLDCHLSWVIHPLSKFRAWYETYLILVFIANLVAKPIDAAFARRQKELYQGYRIISVTLDILCLIDILINFNTGYFVKKTNKVEIRRRFIASNYIHSPYFICDVFSSIPRNLPYFIWKEPLKPILGVMNILGLLKIARIITLVGVINRTTQYHQSKSRRFRFLFETFMVTFILIHWLACMQFIVPRLTGRYFADPTTPVEKSWIYKNEIYHKSLGLKYLHCMFKSSAEILGVQLRFYEMELTEDFVVAIATYMIGKILFAFIWVILVYSILTGRSMELKFYEIMNQLDQYMRQKQLPLDLRRRISKYYDFRYQRNYFKEEMITNLLSTNLKKEVNILVCKSLIASVNLFAELPPDQISQLVAKLIPEIFLPKDCIIQSGTYCESMYFISSGTVAVYSHSGKEICHLQDGAYFGEISLVMKNQKSVTTVIAVETTQVYRLKKIEFEKCLMKNKLVFSKIVTEAEQNLKTILYIEEQYKKRLFKQTYQVGVETVKNDKQRRSS